MQSRAHTNPYPDYDKAPNLYLNNGNLHEELSSKIKKLKVNIFEQLKYELDNVSCHSDYSVYTGYSGIALLFFRIALKNSDKELMNTVEDKAVSASKNLKKKRSCFLNGDAGPLAIALLASHFNGKKEYLQYFSKQLLKYVDMTIRSDSMPDELLYGRGGYLYGLLLANNIVGDSLINPQDIRKVVEAILHSGVALAKCRKVTSPPLMYEWHDKNYLGAAHGVSGILYVLLLAEAVLTEYELHSLVLPTLQWLLTQTFPSGNFLSSAGSESDRLVQWCHGAPGFVHLLLLAHKVYKQDRFFDTALKCGDVIWERGLVSKGYSLCHGVSGNGYAFLELYKYTKDEKHLHRAACFAHWCTKYPKHEGMKPDRPKSLYEGIAGILAFLDDLENPDSSTFPAFSL